MSRDNISGQVIGALISFVLCCIIIAGALWVLDRQEQRCKASKCMHGSPVLLHGTSCICTEVPVP